MELKNKVALITGATAGIGREAAMLLAAEGAEIIVTGRHAARGAATAAAITDGGGPRDSCRPTSPIWRPCATWPGKQAR